MTLSEDQFFAWNPGIESNIPVEYQLLETIYNADNVFTDIQQINELTRITGLDHDELVQFRPARLALHELIVRTTANIVVAEGEHEEDLGINFREITTHIYRQYIQPHLPEIEHNYQLLYQSMLKQVNQQLSEMLFTKHLEAPHHNSSTPWKWFKPKAKPVVATESPSARDFRLIAEFREKGLNAADKKQAALYRSLYRVLGAIMNTRGFIGHDQSLLSEVVARHVCNNYGTALIGEAVEDIVNQAIDTEGYSRIPDADNPILISLKGASAAGKSSLRPMLQKMLRQLGIAEDGYGTISPDIWRRLLLDYQALGAAYKYAGRLTSFEVNIIDSRLDHYIRKKAEIRHSIPHLVVDRFRFDSFSSEKVSRILHKTYVHYVDTMYMYFVITPPEETVTRGWERGLCRGRYKAVEDFLGHSVEAYAGIPKLLFKWLAYQKPRFVFEFLDNSVPRGSYPTTIARGTQSGIEIFDVMAFVDIQRYQHINVLAENPESVYPDSEILSIEKNLDFLQQCVQKISQVSFIDLDSGNEYLRAKQGQFRVSDPNLFECITANPAIGIIFSGLGVR
ncbi:MAG: hypothetical protein GY820_36680 [Gammaproteobacteria bacterium]|nr:hypothetical protein [Gammaproteobacteria bacterium]